MTDPSGRPAGHPASLPVGGRVAGSGGRLRSLRGELVRAGVDNTSRAEQILGELEQCDLAPTVTRLAKLADPDLALLTLSRLAGTEIGRVGLAKAKAGPAWDRLLAVVGGSAALGDHLVRHPEHMAVLSEPDLLEPTGSVRPSSPAGPGSSAGPSSPARPGEGQPLNRWADFRDQLVRAVGGDPADAQPVATSPASEPLRLAYRKILLQIAAQDLASDDPTGLFPMVSAALADLAGAVLEAGLAVARAGIAEHGKTRLAVIAVGKTGGRELNYLSDVDVIYVSEPASPLVPAEEALAIATRLATALQLVTFGPAGEPPIWQIDPNLRPEGKNGPLLRTLESHLAYCQKWAQTWEFQALLKARPVAGDLDLGAAYYEATRRFVWNAVESDNFVEDAQAMRRRVEDNVPPAEASRQIKLGRGGLRDVEFTVQLLQLVHGRSDASLRVAGTLEAIDALCQGGYVGRAPARRLGECYRLLRVLEHRLQLYRLRRTHLMPTAPGDLRRLARAAGLVPGDAEALDKAWRETRREVRSLHEELYYRPLLPATAKLSAGEAVLAPDAAKSRLAALGYRDPDRAIRHITALTSGVTRPAAIQRQLLPVMLGWFAQAADPDAGLLSFRKLSDKLGSTPWYLRMLRDSAGAAERLSHVLAASSYVSANLDRSPEVVRWLGDDQDLLPRRADDLRAELGAIVNRRQGASAGTEAVRALRRRELTRLATGMTLGLLDGNVTRFAVSAAAGLALEAVLELVIQEFAVSPEGLLIDIGLIGMGSLGGREMAIGSDADVLFVHQARPGALEELAQAQSVAMAARLIQLLSGSGLEPALEIDASLRPEGRAGLLARSVGAYQEYYQRWALTWERQALLRARPVAGLESLTSQFMELADGARYRPGGLSRDGLRELRLMKARIEAERPPRGVEPSRHLKLGPGGLLDVQWVAQLLQLCHAWEEPALRVTGTVEALYGAAQAGLISQADVAILVESWTQAMSIRNANVLWTGRIGPTSDLVPAGGRPLAGVARLLGYGPGQAEQLALDRARLARRARQVFDRVFYG